MKGLVLRAIRAYQRNVSPGRPPACRFQPTCSHYGHEAIERYGLAKGLWLTAKRLLRCNPLSRGGYDPVP
jgi:putative membrane protein insertion efficiency factor